MSKRAEPTDEEAKTLGLRVTAWMLARGLQYWPDGVLYRDDFGQTSRGLATLDGEWPDLRDPATFGALVGVLEGALGFPVCFYVPRIARLRGEGGWLTESAHDNGQSLATDDVQPTRPHALVAALEAVPCVPLGPEAGERAGGRQMSANEQKRHFIAWVAESNGGHPPGAPALLRAADSGDAAFKYFTRKLSGDEFLSGDEKIGVASLDAEPWCDRFRIVAKDCSGRASQAGRNPGEAARRFRGRDDIRGERARVALQGKGDTDVE